MTYIASLASQSVNEHNLLSWCAVLHIGYLSAFFVDSQLQQRFGKSTGIFITNVNLFAFLSFVFNFFFRVLMDRMEEYQVCIGWIRMLTRERRGCWYRLRVCAMDGSVWERKRECPAEVGRLLCVNGTFASYRFCRETLRRSWNQ